MSSLDSSSYSSSMSSYNSTSSDETVIDVPKQLLDDEKYAESGIEILNIKQFKKKYTNGEEDEELKFTFDSTWDTICQNKVAIDFAKYNEFSLL